MWQALNDPMALQSAGIGAPRVNAPYWSYSTPDGSATATLPPQQQPSPQQQAGPRPGFPQAKTGGGKLEGGTLSFEAWAARQENLAAQQKEVDFNNWASAQEQAFEQQNASLPDRVKTFIDDSADKFTSSIAPVSNAVRRGLVMSDEALALENLRENPLAYVNQRAILNQARLDYPQTQQADAIDTATEAGSLGDLFNAWVTNPVGALEKLAENTATFIPNTIEQAKTAVPVGAGTGAVLGLGGGHIGALGGAGIGAGGGLLTSAGVGSASVDAAESMNKTAKSVGYDLNNIEQALDFVSRPELVDLAEAESVINGLPVAVGDFAGAGLGGKLFTSVGRGVLRKLGATLGETGVQAFAGSGGEFGKQVASSRQFGNLINSEDSIGKRLSNFDPRAFAGELSPNEIASEGIMEFLGAGGSAAKIAAGAAAERMAGATSEKAQAGRYAGKRVQEQVDATEPDRLARNIDEQNAVNQPAPRDFEAEKAQIRQEIDAANARVDAEMAKPADQADNEAFETYQKIAADAQVRLRELEAEQFRTRRPGVVESVTVPTKMMPDLVEPDIQVQEQGPRKQVEGGKMATLDEVEVQLSENQAATDTQQTQLDKARDRLLDLAKAPDQEGIVSDERKAILGIALESQERIAELKKQREQLEARKAELTQQEQPEASSQPESKRADFMGERKLNIVPEDQRQQEAPQAQPEPAESKAAEFPPPRPPRIGVPEPSRRSRAEPVGAKAQESKQERPTKKAFHGTPHKMKKFTAKAAGSGEGAQAFGQGMYFAESKGVAEFYKKSVTGESEEIQFKGKHISEAPWSEQFQSDPYVFNRAMTLIKSEILGDSARNDAILEKNPMDWERRAIELGRKHKKDLSLAENEGRLYEVDLDISDNEIVAWDEKVDSQKAVSEKVVAAVSNAGKMGADAARRLIAGKTWGQVHNALVKNKGVRPSTISSALLNEGIKGSKYLDAQSRKRGDGSYNYVIFDDESVSIQKENDLSLKQEAKQQFDSAVDRQPEPSPQPKPKKVSSKLQKLLKDWDFPEAGKDLAEEDFVDEVEALIEEGEAPESLGDLVNEYREAQEQNEDFGYRGSTEDEFEALYDAVLKEAGRGGDSSYLSELGANPFFNPKVVTGAARSIGGLAKKVATAIRDDIQEGNVNAAESFDSVAGAFQGNPYKKDGGRTREFFRWATAPIQSNLDSLQWLRKQFPVIDKLIKAFGGVPGESTFTAEDYYIARDKMLNRLGNRLLEAQQKFTKEYRLKWPGQKKQRLGMIASALRGNKVNLTKTEQAIVDDLSSLLNDTRDYLVGAGVDVAEAENYLTRMFDTLKIQQDIAAARTAGAKSSFLQMAEDAYREDALDEIASMDDMEAITQAEALKGDEFKGVRKAMRDQSMPDAERAKIAKQALKRGVEEKALAQAKALADSIESGSFGLESGTILAFAGGGRMDNTPSFTKGRKLGKAADKHLAPYYVQNPFELVGKYIHSAVAKAERSRRLGPNLEKYFEIEKQLLAEGIGQDIIEVRKAVGTMLGMRVDMTPLAKKGFSVARASVIIGFLSGSVLSSLQEFNAAVGQAGGNPAKQAYRSLRTLMMILNAAKPNMLGKSDAVLLSEALDITGDAALRGESLRRFGSFEFGGKLENTVVQNFMYGTFLPQLTEAQRTATSSHLANVFFKDLSNQFKKNGNSAWVKARLAEFGIEPSKANEFFQWFDKFYKSETQAKIKMIKKGGEMAEMYRTGNARFTNFGIASANSGTILKFASRSPVGSILLALQGFTATFTRNYIKRTGKLAWEGISGKNAQGRLTAMERAHAFGTLYSWLPLMAMTYAVTHLVREPIMNMFKPDTVGGDDEEESFAYHVLEAFVRSGLSGKFDTAINVASGIRWRRQPATVLSGPLVGRWGELVSAIVGIFPGNNADTNTAERKLVREVYNTVVKPMIGGSLMALMPVPGRGVSSKVARGANIGTVQIANNPGVRERIVDNIAGEPNVRGGSSNSRRPARGRSRNSRSGRSSQRRERRGR